MEKKMQARITLNSGKEIKREFASIADLEEWLDRICHNESYYDAHVYVGTTGDDYTVDANRWEALSK